MMMTHSCIKVIDILIAARVLATYLIPGCVGRGVRLGSESLSVVNVAIVAAGVQKSGNLRIWKFEIWEPVNLEIWNPKQSQK